MRCPFTLGLSEAAILPSGGICVLLVRKRGLEVGVLMNNAAGNEMGDDGTETQAASNLFICALLSYNFLNYLSHSWGDKTSHSGLGVKAETHECIHTL